MKKVFFLALMALIIQVNIQGCKKSSPIIGKWEVTQAEGVASDLNKGTLYIFEDETNLSLEKDGIKNKAVYKISNDTLKYTIGTIEIKATYKIESKTLVIKNIESDQILTLEKK